MMHSNMKQILIQNGYARPIFARSKEISRVGFFTRPGGRRYRSNSWRISVISLKFGGMMHGNMKQIAV